MIRDLPWIQVQIEAEGTGALRASVTASSAGGSTPGRALGVETVDSLLDFNAALQRRAERGEDLDQALRERSRALYQALFDGDRGRMADQLRGVAGGRLVVRLMVSDPRLRGVAWEALRGPGDLDGAIATHPTIAMARGVFTDADAMEREVRDALRLLVVAAEPQRAIVEDMRRDMEPLIASGHIEWLPPAIGSAARWSNLLLRLRSAPRPHALHFIGHGRVREGDSEILLDAEADAWVAVSKLGQALESTVADELRLVYLESCSGAEPGSLATAAEHLVGSGIEAVVAHLWPVDGSVARAGSRAFYSALTDSADGDTSEAMNIARLTLSGEAGLEYLCPVLYLLGHNPQVFDFGKRRLQAALRGDSGDADADKAVSLTPRQRVVLDKVEAVLRGPGTLLVGDYLGADGSRVGQTELAAELVKLMGKGEHDSLPALMQRFELAEEREELKYVVQGVLEANQSGEGGPRDPLVDMFARAGGAGLYITLLWLPLLEEALAFASPQLEIFVIQPLRPGGMDRLRVFHKESGSTEWKATRELPDRFDLERQAVVVRLYGGYTAGKNILLGDPVLTEDDHLKTLALLEQLPAQLLAYLRNHPVMAMGIAPLAWSHRELIRRLGGDRPLAEGSLAVLGDRTCESSRRYWNSERGPAGRGSQIEVVELSELAAIAGAGR